MAKKKIFMVIAYVPSADPTLRSPYTHALYYVEDDTRDAAKQRVEEWFSGANVYFLSVTEVA